MKSRFFVLLILSVPLVAVLALAEERSAWAGACCLSSSAFGVGRLAPFEDFAIITNESASDLRGRWDEKADWNTASYSESEFRTQLAVIVAVHDRLQASAQLPWLLTRKSTTAIHETGYGIGDAQLSLRYEPVATGKFPGIPGVAISSGLTLPSGRAHSEPDKVLGSDITGRGAWVLSASVTVELARHRWFVLGGAGGTYSLRQDAVDPGHTTQLGRGFQTTLVGGLEVSPKWLVSLLAHYAYEGQAQYDGVAVPASQIHDLGVGPGLAFQCSENLTLQAAIDSGIFVSGVGKNHDGRISAILGVRYAHF